MKSLLPLRLLIVFGCILMTKLLSAHEGSVSGVLAHIETRNPVSDVLVYVVETNSHSLTDAFGAFSINNLPKGNYHLEFTHIGFAIEYREVEVEESQNTFINVALNPAPVSLESVTVNAKVTHAQNIISGIDMQLRPIDNAQNLLRLVPGLFIAQHAGGGKAEQIFLRGFDIDHGTDISINVDGIPVNMVSHAHGQGYADLHFLIPEIVQTTSFLKGPYQSTYTDFATAGAINFKTFDVLPESAAQMSVGQFNTRRTVALLNIPMSTYAAEFSNAYLAAELSSSDGPFESPQNFHRVNVFGKYTSNINAKTMLRISGSFFDSKWNASGQIPVRAVESGLITRFGAIDDDEGGLTSRVNGNLQLIKKLNSQLYLSNQVYYTQYDFELYSNFTFFLEDSINGDMIKQKESRNIYGYRSELNGEHTVFGNAASWQVGFALRFDQVNENELSHVAERTVLLNRLAYGNVTQLNSGIYFSEKLTIGNRIALQAGIRYDQFQFGYEDLLQTEYDLAQVDAEIVTGNFNVDFTLNNNNALYLYTGKGFHSNDTRVVVTQGAAQTLPAAYGADFGLRSKIGKSLLFQPAIWMLYLEQEFVYVGDAAIVEAGGRTLRKGIDLSARYTITDYLFLDADVNYTLAENLGVAEDEQNIPLAAKWTSVGGLTMQLQNGLNAALRYRYMGDRPANEDGSVIAEGYWIHDVVVNYTFKNFTFGLDIQNVFNVEWNEAQFETESRLYNEPAAVSELHFTPGTPFFIKGTCSVRF